MAANAVEKAFCVLELSKTNSVTAVEWHFQTCLRKRLQIDNPSMIGTRNSNQQGVCAKVRVLEDHQFLRNKWSVFGPLTNGALGNLQ